MRVLFFGDSITQGFWAKDGGWVELIRKHYDTKAIENLKQQNEPTIFNLGISGDTTRNLLARIENEVKVRIWENDPIIVVIAIGTNDDVFESDEQWVSPEEFRKNLQKIVDLVKPLARQVVLIGNPACDEKLTTPVFWGDFNYTNGELARSEKDIGNVAEQNSIKYIPVFDKFKEQLDAGVSLLSDGLHPNDAGHKFMSEIILPEIQRILSEK